ncbi:hypothetical protein Vafri_4693 [Volvox africanus]|uniref:Uncharacterized protein n=1 Tax=Volvox africanus TaxID=51714 RepID=A0A8J4AVS0_9CHLO|nr:hypothetical protein Vafri_4693 [Volvox africanus]
MDVYTPGNSLFRYIRPAPHVGMYTPPADASAMESYPLRLDAVMDAVTMLADETSDAIRRLLYGVMLPYSSGHYIPGGYYGGLYGGYFGGYYGGLYGGYYGGYYGGGHYSLAPMYPQKSDLLMSQLGFPTGHTAQQLTAPAALRGSQTTIPAMQPFPSPGATSSPPPVPQTPSEFQAPQPSSPQWSRSRPKRNRSPHHYNRRLVRN